MTYAKLVNASILTAIVATSSLAYAGDSAFEKEFINKTLLGNWKAQTVTADDHVRNVDISKDRFLDSILGKTKRITGEVASTQNNVDAALATYTKQFDNKKS